MPGRPRSSLPYKRCQGDREGRPYHTRIEILYITESVLYWLSPTRFARFLLRVMTYPGGSPLMIRTASTSSTGASSFSPAHALLDATIFQRESIPLQT